MSNSTPVSQKKYSQLCWEVENLQNFLDEFDRPLNGELRSAQLGSTFEYISVRNFPLPDQYSPDYIDLIVLTDMFPAVPPIGIYILSKRDKILVNQIEERFNVFEDKAFHEAPAIPGFTWICTHYEKNAWKYCVDDPRKGDNVRKFLVNFYTDLMD